jgi:hypothetical protein
MNCLWYLVNYLRFQYIKSQSDQCIDHEIEVNEIFKFTHVIVSVETNVVHCGSWIIAVCSNFATLQCQSVTIAGISQHFELNSVSQNNLKISGFFYGLFRTENMKIKTSKIFLIKKGHSIVPK